MSHKTGKPYESLTQIVFQAIHAQKEFPNLEIERNVTLQGKTARHQIDVYWKFEFSGVPHETIVQTKDWNKPVEQVHLLAFKAILDDLPGQPRGIFVTRSGYQQGAKEFALKHGIILYELREADYPPTLPITAGGWARIALVPMPLEGLLKMSDDPPTNPASAVALGFYSEIFTPKYTQIAYEIPANWLNDEYPGIDPLQKLAFPPAQPHKILFFDDSGVEVGNLGSVTEKIIEGMRKDQVNQRQVTHVFDPPVFVQTGDAVIPRIKVAAVSVSVEVTRTECLRRAKMSNLSQVVLHQLNSDKRWWFGATPQVITRLSKKRRTKTKKKTD